MRPDPSCRRRVLATAKRVLPPELLRAIVMQAPKAFAQHGVEYLTDNLPRRVMPHLLENGDLKRVVALMRCTPRTTNLYAIGFAAPWWQHAPYNTCGVETVLTRYSLCRTVRSKEPTRYLAAVYRLEPVHGPWNSEDATPGLKVAFVPERSMTAVIGGQTKVQAENLVYSMMHELVRSTLPWT
jgi:hypothetical protein